MKLELKKFDMRNIKDGSTVILLGKRGTGKSFMVKDMFKHHTDWPIGVVISATERANHFFEKFIPKMLIYDEFESKILERFIERQEKITNQRNIEVARNRGSDLDPRAFMVLDDCLYDKSWPNDKSIRCLFMNGRHYNITFCITMQYPLGIPPVLRANVDYVFILRENMITNRERIWKQYAGMFPTFQSFNQVLDQTTQNYECLVIDNKTQSNKLEDQVYWYKAENIDATFRVCSPELWSMQEADQQRRDLGLVDGDEDDDEPYSDMVIKKTNKHPSITVRKSNTSQYSR
jgi:hypothetical protein